MGLDYRKRSGKIANGSRLIVSGEVTRGQKGFPNSFNMKTNPYDLTPSQKDLVQSVSGTTTN